jgi:Fe-Mn family superoxide dismutase
MNRRQALGRITVGAMAVAVARGGESMAQQPANPAPGTALPGPAGMTPGQHAVKPLPFDPKTLRGLSERMIVSHHDNNYAGAVKSLGKVEEELARLKPDAFPALVGGLRERALQFLNSMTLHEWYFGNLGGDGKQSGVLARALPSNWESEFRATALSLAGGSGWVTLSLHSVTGELLTAWSGNHTQSPAGTLPLLVLDMYEHAYALDYGAAAAKYVDAFFANVRWDEVERRYERAQAAFKALNSLK